MLQALKQHLSLWSLFERIWVGCFISIAIFISFWSGYDLLGFAAFLSGVLCVVLIAKGLLISFWVGYINILLYAWSAWLNGLYGEVGLNLLFFLPVNVVGHCLWYRNIQANGQLEIRRMSRWAVLLSAILCAAGTFLLGRLLALIAGQHTPYLDALTNVFSVVAFSLQMLRYREQWLVWLVLDVVSVVMWSLRWYHGSPQGAMMVLMWGAYLGNGIYGWISWNKRVKEAHAAR